MFSPLIPVISRPAVLRSGTAIRIFICCVLGAFLVSSCKDDAQDPLPPLPALEEEVLEAVNAHRLSIGLDSLQMNSFMREEARKHSSNMALKLVPLGHDGFQSRVNRIYEVLGSGDAGENVAMSNNDAWYTVDSLWLLSPGHKGNIEGAYTHTGIGVVEGKNGYFYYTQIFLSRKK